ncbi:UDP-2,4-diacetamido-2,4,6-trideoxy-beta-L-altropyranose hydrolase [Paenibacillus psychroresistens]|uniref:UDP-2,4-diacetamido-2,4, 6-trideoxy-beta-L-altropyranose hydrolase n=1 Tax=Paenibacillus psychroresistens TaxID=1778678 RepID=A0A6B8RD37_9BACL|nr:UDP-2,4-diacetamido-2,4,6-trideoxy-beta-L-altropyranose hydrolase [Paenibacillus psychroresistens]QGQ94361.1 UDP-2,4-diacetamido-2,4,6-trideoxy-beta-L-altropyranose hydrolase [Paenibacillus psychroresistens]
MLIYFRVDASLLIGTGHVMRCLSLAEQLHDEGNEIGFICREHLGNLTDYIKSKGYTVHTLLNPVLNPVAQKSSIHSDIPPYPNWLGVSWHEDAEQTLNQLNLLEKRVDWLVLDHYSLDEQYEKMLRPYVNKILVIDDLANRKHDCDVLLDHNYFDNMANRYEGLISRQCQLVVGPTYALLRKEFQTAQAAVRVRDGHIRNVLVSFGGVDITGETMKTLQALWPFAQQGLIIHVLLGKMNPHNAAIMDFCRKMPHCFAYEHVENMRELMEDADIAIGAGGTTTWERCCLGLPSLVITTAQNQEGLTEHVTRTGATGYLGKSNEVTSWIIHERVKQMMTHPEQCREMSARASQLVDGLGISRICKELRKWSDI